MYKFDPDTGAITNHSECMTPIGNAARHLAVHPNGRNVYIDEEAGAMVTAHQFDASTGVLTRTQTLPTLRPGDRGSTSECELGPDGRVLYVANRAGDQSTIAAFAVSPDGSLSPRGHALCGNHPRFFQVDPSRKWLLVNAMADKAVNVLPLDDDGVPSSPGPVSTLSCGFPAVRILYRYASVPPAPRPPRAGGHIAHGR